MLDRLARWGEITVPAMLRLQVLLYDSKERLGCESLLGELNAAFVGRLGLRADAAIRLTSVFHHEPMLLSRYLLSLGKEERRRFTSLLEAEVWSADVEALRRRALHFCRLHCVAGGWFLQLLLRVLGRHPDAVERLHEPSRLRTLSKGVLAGTHGLECLADKRQALARYFELELCRIGLECLDGASGDTTDAVLAQLKRLHHVDRLTGVDPDGLEESSAITARAARLVQSLLEELGL